MVVKGRCGNFHQGDVQCFGQGFQCTMIAFVALLAAFSGRYSQPDLWTSENINDIVLTGSQLYDRTAQVFGWDQPRYLFQSEVPTTLDIWESVYSIQVCGDLFYGVIGSNSDAAPTSTSFRNALRNAFQISNSLLFTSTGITIAIFEHNDQYFLFDSHARNQYGAADSNGNSVLLDFSDLCEIFTYIEQFYLHQQYELSPIIISHVPSSSPEKTTFSSNSKEYQVSQTADQNVTRTIGNDEISHLQRNSLKSTPYRKLALHNSVRHLSKKHACNQKEVLHNKSTNKMLPCDYANTNFAININVRQIAFNHSYTVSSKCIRKKPTSHNSPQNQLNNNAHSEKKMRKKRVNKVSPCDDATTSNADNTVAAQIAANHSNSANNGKSDYSSDPNYINYAPNLSFLNKRVAPDTYNYEQYIQTIANCSCRCCHSFLFADKKTHLRRDTNTSRAYKLNVLDDLCPSCCQQIAADKIPKFSHHANMFDTAIIPTELQNLNNIEKRLISLIQIFMTVIQLPGGQYAERGSVVNFMSPYINIAKQLPATDNIIAVRFSDRSPSLANIISFVSSLKLQKALTWLQFNNHLYADCLILSGSSDEISVHTIDFESMNESSITASDYSVPNVNISDAVNEKNLITLHRISTPPVSPYALEYGEEMAFPWLFSNGINGYLTQRPMKISLKDYFHQRMKNVSGNFRKDISYLLNSVNVCDNQQLLTDISIHMLMRKPQRQDCNVTAKDIKHLQDNPDLLQNSYMFMKGIRGTVAYWKNALSNLLAMLKSLGPPTLFVTLSANDCHWPELAMALTNCKYEDVHKHIKNLPSLMKKDPYMTAIHFQRRYNALFKFILKSTKKPLGEIDDFFIRVEFQNRGSPHYHLFYWIKDVPPVTNAATAENAVKYIDRTISTCLPDKASDEQFYNLVKQLQTHSHTEYCMKNRPACRFGFPYQPADTTHFFSNFDIALRGKRYATKRTADDAYINAYNPSILRHFRSNMDIQFVNNAESAAYYVCAYLCKAEPDELKKEFSKLITDLLAKEDITLHSRLLKIGCCVLKNRRLSAQEAAFRISNLKLLQSSRNIVYLNCKPKSKRMKVLKPLTIRSQLPDDSTDIFHSNIIDYYHARPTEFESMSLFVFASSYQVCPYSAVGPKALPRFRLQKFDKWIRQKQKKNVIRLPKFQLNSDDYYFSLLLLLLPHRNEEDLIQPYKSAEEALFKKYSEMDNSYNSFAYITDQIENAVRLYRLTHDEVSQTFMLSSLTEPVDKADEASTDLTFPQVTQPIQYKDAQTSESHTLHQDYQSDEYELHSLQTTAMSDTLLTSTINQLTKDQTCVLDYIKQKITNPVRSEHEKALVFVSGGAGVGKSFLLSLIADYLSVTTPLKYGETPVLLTAPTGTAARNIHGQTLHSALALPVDNNEFCDNKYTMSSWTLKKLRQKFAFIHTIMIDEISMVSAKTFSLIHEQLCKIADNDNIFGNYNIIIFGDFFQLRPVKGRFAFENCLLWSHFTPFILNQNMRQSSNQQFIHLLNRARIGAVASQNVTVLKSLVTQSTEQLPAFNTSCLHLFPKLKTVQQINCQILQSKTIDTVTVSAIHLYSQNDIASSQEFSTEHIPLDDRKAGGMPKILTLCNGCRIMLLRNIFTSQGLVNGALGHVETIEYGNVTDSSQVKIPSRIFVLFDDPTIGTMLQQPLHHNAVAIEMCDQEYFYKGRCIIRRQFPLNLAWAVTIHKSQGATLEKVYCDIGSDIFQPGMSYVALSRVKTLQGLTLYAFAPEKVKADRKVLEFYEKISNQNSHKMDIQE